MIAPMVDRSHLALITVRALDPARLKSIAAALRITAYDVRMRLRSPIPRSMSIFPSIEAAHAAGLALAGDDLIAVAYRESNLPPSRPFAAFRMGRRADAFIFESRSRERITLRIDEVARLVVGFRGDVQTKSTLEARPPSYIGRGARSSYQVDVKKTRQRDVTMFVAFFPQSLSQSVIHVVADQFDFACLGKRKGASDMINQRTLCEIIESALPEHVVDKRLLDHRVYPDMVPHNRRNAPDAAFAAAQLIDWEHRAHQSGGYLNTHQF